MFLELHNSANLIHHRLIPVVGLIPPRIAAVEIFNGRVRRPGKIPPDIVVIFARMIRLELDIPSVIRKGEHVLEWISHPSQIDVAI